MLFGTQSMKTASKYNLLLLLLLVNGSHQQGEPGACTFRFKGTTKKQPVPLEVRYENSLTSCGMACTMNFQCQYFALSGKTCVLADNHDGKEESDAKWSIYKKV